MARRTTQPTTELGRLLEKERDNLNLNMQEMADHLGVSKPAYLGWLRGSVPEPQNIKVISDTLGITTQEIMECLIIHGMTPAEWAIRPIQAFAQGARLKVA